MQDGHASVSQKINFPVQLIRQRSKKNLLKLNLKLKFMRT